MVWVELLIRAAAVYVAVLFLPLALASLAWPAIAHWCRRLVDTLVALVLGKFVIVSVLSLAAGALAGGTGSARRWERFAAVGSGSPGAGRRRRIRGRPRRRRPPPVRRPSPRGPSSGCCRSSRPARSAISRRSATAPTRVPALRPEGLAQRRHAGDRGRLGGRRGVGLGGRCSVGAVGRAGSAERGGGRSGGLGGSAVARRARAVDRRAPRQVPGETGLPGRGRTPGLRRPSPPGSGPRSLRVTASRRGRSTPRPRRRPAAPRGVMARGADRDRSGGRPSWGPGRTVRPARRRATRISGPPTVLGGRYRRPALDRPVAPADRAPTLTDTLGRDRLGVRLISRHRSGRRHRAGRLTPPQNGPSGPGSGDGGDLRAATDPTGRATGSPPWSAGADRRLAGRPDRLCGRRSARRRGWPSGPARRWEGWRWPWPAWRPVWPWRSGRSGDAPVSSGSPWWFGGCGRSSPGRRRQLAPAPGRGHRGHRRMPERAARRDGRRPAGDRRTPCRRSAGRSSTGWRWGCAVRGRGLGAPSSGW